MFVRIVNTRTSKWLLQALHWILPFISLYFIFVLIGIKTQNQTVVNRLDYFFGGKYFLPVIILLVAFTLINVFLESLKWKLALQPFQKISKSEAMVQTLAAMAAGFITPFRSGALLSRFYHNESTGKSHIINATLKMGAMQFLVTVLFSVAGLVIYLGYFQHFIAAFFISVLIFISFFVLNRIRINKREISVWRKYQLSLTWDFSVFLLSFLRYLTFSLQYLFILLAFGVNASPVLLFALITFTFFVNTMVPSGILGKIGIRELSGILIIGETTGFVVETSCAAFLIWILNQALPALVGSVIHLKKIT